MVNAREQSMLAPLLGEVVQGMGERPAALSYRALLDDVEAGAVPADHFPTLESFLELGLHTGRFRARFGGLGEEALVRLFHQTPRGAMLAEAVGEVNRALASLVGQTIEHIDLATHGPDSYALGIQTDRCRLTVRIEPTGIRISDLELAV